MKPQTIGRTLGIGLRIAGRIAGQQIAGNSQASAPAQSNPQNVTRPNPAPASRAAGKASRNLARGLGGFLRPFTRIGGILWLEVTGVFFLLFVLVFAPLAWRTRPSHWQGPYDHNFLISVGIVLLFLYLSVTSFWRAHKK